MGRRRVALILASLCAVLLAGCGDGGAGSAAEDGGRVSVVATTTQLADFTRNVGGDRVEVTSLLKPNVDAHDFEPSPADLDALARADILVENGVGLEDWLQGAVDASGFSGERVDTSAGVPLLEGGGDHEGEAEHADDAAVAEGAGEGTAEDGAGGEDAEKDPHIWQSPANAKIMVANVEAALSRADPAGAATYRANRDRYSGQLDALDAEVAAEISKLSNRKMVTNHDAFAYYIDRYGLEFVGSIVPSFDTSAELSAAEVENVVTAIRATGVKAVFSETSLPPETAQTIASDAGVRVVTGSDALYGDSLGPPGSEGATYLDAIRHNTRTIVANLS